MDAHQATGAAAPDSVPPCYLAPGVNRRLLTLARTRGQLARAMRSKREALTVVRAAPRDVQAVNAAVRAMREAAFCAALYLRACADLGIDEPELLP